MLVPLEFVEIRPTNACQLNCVGCWNYSPYLKTPRSVDWKQQVLAIEDYKKILVDISELKAKELVFSGGGDPLAHRNIVELIQLAKTQGLKVGLISNLLLAKNAKDLANSGLNWVLANFSAGSPEVYTEYHPNQTADSFYKILEIIELLSEAGVKVNLNCVLCRINYGDIENMLRIAARTTRLMSFKILTGSEYIGTHRIVMSPSEIAELRSKIPVYKKLAEELKVSHNFELLNVSLQKNFKGQLRFPIEKISCYAGYYTSVVHANGDVTVCCHTDSITEYTGEGYEVIGNIHQNSFKEIWYSPKYTEVRERLVNRNYFNFCKDCSAHYFFKNASVTAEVSKFEARQK